MWGALSRVQVLGALPRIEVDVVDLVRRAHPDRGEAERHGPGADEAEDVAQQKLEPRRGRPGAAAADGPAVEHCENPEEARNDHLYMKAAGRGKPLHHQAEVPVAE